MARNGLVRDLVLTGAVTLAYANGLRGEFQFDDYTVIVHNAGIRDLSAWAASMPGIRPLLKLSYALNWSSGLGTAGFHAVNLVCHIAAALLAMRLCGRPPCRRWPSWAMPRWYQRCWRWRLVPRAILPARRWRAWPAVASAAVSS